MIRLGLCCAFRDAPIRFRTTTAAAMLRLSQEDRRARLAEITRGNAQALQAAVRYCADQGIGCFRVNSQVLPLRTHPKAGYAMTQLPGGDEIVAAFRTCGQLASETRVRLTFHPDQFVVLNSPHARIVEASIAELEYQAEVADWIGADVITIHGGGAYGDKAAALDRLRRNLGSLAGPVRDRIALENDDRVFTPAELLPVCESEGVPLVYDVHHHRCLPDGLSVSDVTNRARAAWNREPLFHVSSPANGWSGDDPRPHAEYIQPRDFPREWTDLPITVEVEARAKEAAVLRLLRDLPGRPKKPSRSSNLRPTKAAQRNATTHSRARGARA